MGRQIRFFLCSTLRTAIESEAHLVGAPLVDSHPSDEVSIQFSTSSGTDTHQVRLWTDAANRTRYELLCRAVKKDAVYDRESGLWVKRTSDAAFDAYRAEQKCALSELLARNQEYAIEVLGGRVTEDEESIRCI